MYKIIFSLVILSAITFHAIAEETPALTKEKWESASKEDQENLKKILKNTKLMPENDDISLLYNHKPIDMKPFGFNPFKEVCLKACDAAAIVGAGACTGTAAAIAFCLIGVESSRKYCKDHC